MMENIKQLRKDRGLTQEALAEILDVSRQAVAKWELGQSYPDVEKLIELSNFFKVTVDFLLKNGKEECSLSSVKREVALNNEEIEFLCKAKKLTYAGKGPESESSRPKSRDLEYSEGKFKYIDTYLGGEKFIGEEALWVDDIPIWAMNYAGRVLGDNFSGDFLKESLLLVSEEYPYRGPLTHSNGRYAYHSIVDGDVNWFIGYEEIFYSGIKVYECRFHGGLVK